MEKLLRRPIPYRNESLLSYLIRISIANEVELEWIFNKTEISLGKNTNYINMLNDNLIIRRIADLTGIDFDELRNMTICSYPYSSGRRLGVYTRHDKFQYYDYIKIENVKYCPHCLEEGNYHRKHWHVTPLMICKKHKNLLIDKCNNCGSKLSIKNIVYGKCDCNSELKKVPSTYSTNSTFNNIQDKVFEFLEGYSQYGNFTVNDDNIRVDIINPLNKLHEFIIKNLEYLAANNSSNKTDLLDSDEIYSFLIISKIIFEIDILFLMIDNITCIPYNGLLDIVERLSSTGIIPSIISPKLAYYNKILEKNLIMYVRKNYKYSYFEERLAEILVNDKYLNIIDAHTIFNLDCSYLSNEYSIIYIDDKMYVNIHGIIDLIKGFINKCDEIQQDNSHCTTIEYTTIQATYYDFKAFGFSEIELIQILKKSRIKCVLNPYSSMGMNVVRIHKRDFYRILLEKSLEKFN